MAGCSGFLCLLFSCHVVRSVYVDIVIYYSNATEGENQAWMAPACLQQAIPSFLLADLLIATLLVKSWSQVGLLLNLTAGTNCVVFALVWVCVFLLVVFSFFLIWFYSWLHNRSSASVSCQLSSSCHSCIHLWLSSFTVSHSHNKETDHRESMALLCLQTEPSCHSEHTAHLYLILTLHRHHILFCQCRILLMQNHFFSFWQKKPQKLQILPIWKKSSEL